jgi:DNA-binding response OmpR family regulator
VTALSDGGLPITFLLLALADDTLADPIKECMRQAGREVVRTSSRRETLQMVRAIQPDLLVLDGALEDSEGFEVCRLLRSERVNTAVILLTIENSADERAQGLNLGADDCPSRTSALDELMARVAANRIPTAPLRPSEPERRSGPRSADRARLGETVQRRLRAARYCSLIAAPEGGRGPA